MPPRIPSSEQSLYYALIEGKERGPFDLDFLEALVLSSVCGSDVKVRRSVEDGNEPVDDLNAASKRMTDEYFSQFQTDTKQNHWVELASFLPPPIPPRPNLDKRPQSVAPKPPPVVNPPTTASNGTAYAGLIWMGIVFFLMIAVLSSKSCSSTSTYSQQVSDDAPPPVDAYTPPAPPPPVIPEQTQPADTPANLNPSIPQTLLSPSEPAATPEVPVPNPPSLPSPPANPPETTDSITDDSGHSFRVPHAYGVILDSKKVTLNRILKSINQLKRSREAAGRQIYLDRANLDNTNQVAVDQFNAEVDRYNQEGTQLDSAIDQYNAGIKNYNDYLSQIGTPSN